MEAEKKFSSKPLKELALILLNLAQFLLVALY